MFLLISKLHLEISNYDVSPEMSFLSRPVFRDYTFRTKIASRTSNTLALWHILPGWLTRELVGNDKKRTDVRIENLRRCGGVVRTDKWFEVVSKEVDPI